MFAPKTLMLAWMKVRANKGAAGVDGQSIARFAAKADVYLSELSAALKDGTYRPEAVKRVDIPKGPIFFALRARGGSNDRPTAIGACCERPSQEGVVARADP